MTPESVVIDELTRIADECDERGLFEISNEIDAAINASMTRTAEKGGMLMKLLSLLGKFTGDEQGTPEPSHSKSLDEFERKLEKPKKWDPWERSYPAKDDCEIDSSTNRGIDESRNRFAQWEDDDFEDDDFQENSCPQCDGPGILMGTLGNREAYRCRNCGMEFGKTKELPWHLQTDMNDADPEELEAASEILESLLNGSQDEKDWCPECNFEMKTKSNGEKFCPHCSRMKDDRAPRISFNLGTIPGGYTKLASSEKKDLSNFQKEMILKNMR